MVQGTIDSKASPQDSFPKFLTLVKTSSLDSHLFYSYGLVSKIQDTTHRF